MRVGVPSEVKNHEYRVGLTPAATHHLRTPSRGDGDGQDRDAQPPELDRT